MSLVLIVEDDEQLARACVQILERAGYRVAVAHDGVDAIRLLKSLAIDLLLVDMFLPTRDGFEVLAACRLVRPGIPILAVSGGGGVSEPGAVLADAKRLGAAGAIAKPFSESELLDGVARALGQQPPSGDRSRSV
jgi:CheY-like chemotaxis protein